jgi:hypothetical protein
VDIPIPDKTLVSRYIVFSKWFRADKTIRPDAFIPDDSLELSVTHQYNLSEKSIWDIGNKIAKQRSCSLYGRADVTINHIKSKGLDFKVDPDPITQNPNHAIIINWPPDKSARKMLAMRMVTEPQLYLIDKPTHAFCNFLKNYFS